MEGIAFIGELTDTLMFAEAEIVLLRGGLLEDCGNFAVDDDDVV